MANGENVNTATGEIVEGERMTLEELAETVKVQFAGQAIDDDILRQVSSFEEAMQLAEEINGSIAEISEVLGSGFQVTDKNALVGKDMVLIQWKFNDGTWGTFVSAFGMTKDGKKFIINDGGTGIPQDLLNYTYKTGRTGGLRIPRGLSESVYPTCVECGRPRKPSDVECPRCGDNSERRAEGATYYLDTTPI